MTRACGHDWNVLHLCQFRLRRSVSVRLRSFGVGDRSGQLGPSEDGWELSDVQVEVMEIGVPTGTLYQGDLIPYAAEGYELGEIGVVVTGSKQNVAACAVFGGYLELFYICVSKNLDARVKSWEYL